MKGSSVLGAAVLAACCRVAGAVQPVGIRAAVATTVVSGTAQEPPRQLQSLALMDTLVKLDKLAKASTTSGFGDALRQLGLAVMLGAFCVSAVAMHQGAASKAGLQKVLTTAGLWQVAVIAAAIGMFILCAIVNVPAYVVVFLLGSGWNVISHCRR
mmetsp:Transcript_59874/g.154135  ORF Transcript_59874/g.154135 Transcript_59874/m.154135 type:complete len:156 (+) Transcript_59874:94-561(+)|eukprot:CAMPEP_0195115318 /NCGR_PEP_ID=MMETSP0448-20130528/108626_1 /TAXON_ID=66468 /ORGANISM="Heterocapsa triquestra, Strain CCMP 448" /LENGTH=155 /DNA_ID=CAMNT_0040152413 /DNA_START=45 /DNA_END=512 /DNA_ORIENTATION=-